MPIGVLVCVGGWRGGGGLPVRGLSLNSWVFVLAILSSIISQQSSHTQDTGGGGGMANSLIPSPWGNCSLDMTCLSRGRGLIMGMSWWQGGQTIKVLVRWKDYLLRGQNSWVGEER
jgi:hypothetical protein